MSAWMVLVLAMTGAEPGPPAASTERAAPPAPSVAPPPAAAPKMGAPAVENTMPTTELLTEEFGVVSEERSFNQDAYINGWRHVFGSGYFRADFLYFWSTDPKERGPVFGARSVTVTQNPISVTTSLVTFNTGMPNVDPEMGFRLLWGRELTDVLSAEVGGFYVHRFEYPVFFTSGTFTSGGLTGGASTTTVTPVFVPTNTLLNQVGAQYNINRYGVENNARVKLIQTDKLRLDGIVGLRWIHYGEAFYAIITPQNALPLTEAFNTNNNLFGGQVGAELEFGILEYLSLRTTAKGVFGGDWQDVDVVGPSSGGFLTGPGNRGDRSRVSSGAAVDLGMGLVFHLTPNLHVHIGGNVMYLSNVLRSMDQFDLAGAAVGNPVLLRPNVTEIWMGGLAAGLEVRF